MQCKTVLDRIDALSGEYLDVLERACLLESPTADKAAVDAVGSYFLALAKARGWQTEVYPQTKAGDMVCITTNPRTAAKPITLSGHLDTVHPIGSFGMPAVRRDEVKMYGPGVMDCKGGVVAAFLAMDALDQCGFDRRPIQLLLQTDEETGSSTSGKATIRYICEKAKDSVAFLNLEGYVAGTAVLIRKGILRYRFTVHGKALHSARCCDASNAIAEAASKILQLEEMKDPGGLTCNCGMISGGTAANTVAEKCEFYVDIRFLNEEQQKTAEETVMRIARQSRIAGCTCDVELISLRPAMPDNKRNRWLLQKMNESYRKNGLPELKARLCLSGSDAAYATEAGIPCVDCIGTEGGNIHSVDEFILLDSLAASAKRIASVIFDF